MFQDSMTCDWEDSAFPCPQAPQLYDRNNHFFVVPAEDVQRTNSTPIPSPALRDLSPIPSHSPTPVPSISPFLLRRTSNTTNTERSNSSLSITPDLIRSLSPSLKFTPIYTHTSSTSPPHLPRATTPSSVSVSSTTPHPAHSSPKPTIISSPGTTSNLVPFRRSRPFILRSNLNPSSTLSPNVTYSPSSSSSAVLKMSSSPLSFRHDLIPSLLSCNTSLSPSDSLSPTPSTITSLTSTLIPFRRSPTLIPLNLNFNSGSTNSPGPSSSSSSGINSRSSQSLSPSPSLRHPPSYRLRAVASYGNILASSTAPGP